MEKEYLIDVRDLCVYFETQQRGRLFKGSSHIKALDGISFQLFKRESFGIVGESGSGKTVLLRSLIRLIEPTSGTIYAFGKNVLSLSKNELKQLRRKMQLVFQNPSTALHPRMSVEQICAEPLIIHEIDNKRTRRDKIARTLEVVGLNPDHIDRFPHQFSGGQKQRIGIARALVLEPEILLLDEPVSALDVSIRAQVLNLFQDLKSELNLTYLIIAHDLSVIRYLCEKAAVIYLGQFVEIGAVETIYKDPKHPYTEALLASVPTLEKSLAGVKIANLPGDLPNPRHPPTGCSFHPRCPYVQEICTTTKPVLKKLDSERLVSCHFR